MQRDSRNSGGQRRQAELEVGHRKERRSVRSVRMRAVSQNLTLIGMIQSVPARGKAKLSDRCGDKRTARYETEWFRRRWKTESASERGSGSSHAQSLLAAKQKRATIPVRQQIMSLRKPLITAWRMPHFLSETRHIQCHSTRGGAACKPAAMNRAVETLYPAVTARSTRLRSAQSQYLESLAPVHAQDAVHLHARRVPADAQGQRADEVPGETGSVELLLMDVLLRPTVHAAAVEGEVAGDAGHLGNRVLVAPDRILRRPAARLHGPVARIALVRAAGGVF